MRGEQTLGTKENDDDRGPSHITLDLNDNR